MNDFNKYEPIMNIEVFSKLNKFKRDYIFNFDINIVFKVFSNPQKYQEMYQPHMKNLTCLKGENKLNSIGSEFSYTWDDTLNSTFIVDEVIDTDFLKSFKVYYKSILPTNFKFSLIYKFYYLSVEKQTLFSYEVIFEIPEALDFFLKYYNIDENLRILLNMEMHINLEIKNHEESIILTVGFSKLWSILNDWKLFHTHVPIFAKKVDYLYNGVLNETIVKVEEEIYILRNKFYKKDRSRGVISFDVKQEESILRIDFYIFSVKHNVCLLTFKHVFLNVISYENLRFLIKSKKEVLKHLKNSLNS